MQSTLRQPLTTRATEIAGSEARQPHDESARRLAKALRAIGEDARLRAEHYPAETIVPEGGE